MNHLFVPYGIAIKFKELGFDEPCLAYYYNNKNIPFTSIFGITNTIINTKEEWKKYGCSHSAPLYSQIIDWFKEKEIRVIEGEQCGWLVLKKYGKFDTYQIQSDWETCDEAIKEAIKLIEK